jgi:hypothetical protein
MKRAKFQDTTVKELVERFTAIGIEQDQAKAVKATLAVAPERARRMLEIIAESREYPQAGEAGMSIDNLERGIFKPT